ncbi:MAG: sulfatase-like hydrolase/transferase [Verrucomicrobia bacterium]|jgi:phosphoglycerol transferase MdoB-like AlkP superfamily enzyme|nr:sulfatase-like hydrolase/transferase [Verrucomicrobiota bacterium]OQC65618.1 MAG: Lipoteichoic acid synthase 1 [Verrucomicrobia bacterium ADurb.Bin006]MDI9380501.1 sulfatase-like hydrolase/transferase [Verrucomicrobiota bacterium]NMD19789.1 sulfatase-like hydrolase/transferase [Verrucomicrobiota bacterium]HOA59944.1 sulfatase-like hydrolase/transferase [Verrucomicrobiota bacterium]
MKWRLGLGQGRATLGHLARPLALWGAWVALFMVFRGVLVGATWQFRSDATPALLVGAFLHGLRFDLSMAAQLVAPFALWSLWRSRPSRWENRLRLGLFTGLVFVVLFTLAAEIEYYKEFQMRLGPLMFQFFGMGAENDRTILGMVWHGYPVLRWLLVCVAATAAFVIGTRRWLIPQATLDGLASRVLATLALAAGTVVATRGGLQPTPLRWGDAVFSQNAYANAMAQNGLYALTTTLRHRGKAAQDSRWLRAMNPAEAIAITRQMVLLPGEQLIEPDTYPLLRRSPPTGLPVVLRRPKNVVVIIMESFSGRFCGATGGRYGATPRFDALARRGLLFEQALSVSTHTAQGVLATLCSFPNLPERDNLMKQPEGNQPMLTLPQLLRRQGFATLFLYNGLLAWDNKEGFFRSHGVEQFIGRHDYVNPVFVDPDWGVSDQDVFSRARQEFDALARTDRPFLGVILTLSNHAPFNLPPVPGLAPITGGGQQNTRLNGIHYADWAIGEFMEQAGRAPWFADTLFVFTGDHGFGLPPVLTPLNLLHEHIPILFYGPAILGDAGERRSVIASQLDILPTILGILGIDEPHQAFGRNLLRLPPDDPGHAYLKQSGDPVVGYLEGDWLSVRALGQASQLYRIDLGDPPSASEDLTVRELARAAALDKRLTAFTVTGLYTLTKQLMAPHP